MPGVRIRGGGVITAGVLMASLALAAQPQEPKSQGTPPGMPQGDTAAPSKPGGVAGRWKFKLSQGNETVTFLMNFSQTEAGWVGDFLSSSATLKVEPKIDKLEVKQSEVRLVVKLGGQEFLNFEGQLQADGRKIQGACSTFGGPLELMDLYRSELRKLDDPFDLARENLQQVDLGPGLFEAGLFVLSRAEEKKLPAEEVRSLVDRLSKTASGYGSRWERATTLKIVRSLGSQTTYADLALNQARRAERMLGDNAAPADQLEVLELLSQLLQKTSKTAEAKTLQAKLTKLEARDYAEFQKLAPKIPLEKVPARQAADRRVIVLEVLSGADANPCVGLDYAVTQLSQSFAPEDLIVLNYHAHAPSPNPLTTPDGLERIGLYAEQIRTLPSILINGKLGPRGGGGWEVAAAKYTELRQAIVPLLQGTSPIKIQLATTFKDGLVTAKATITADKIPEKTVLRWVLTQDRLRYTGKNGLRYHEQVVRDLPGGVAGTPWTKANQEVVTTVDTKAIEAKIEQYLKKFAQEEGEFAAGIPNLALTGLRLAVLVQSEETQEILQAAQVPLSAAGQP